MPSHYRAERWMILLGQVFAGNCFSPTVQRPDFCYVLRLLTTLCTVCFTSTKSQCLYMPRQREVTTGLSAMTLLASDFGSLIM